MEKKKRYVGVILLFWLLIVGINANGLKIVHPDEYYCCKKIIDSSYDYGPYQSPYACDNMSLPKEACQRYIDEQDKSAREAVKEYDKPAWIAFFIILGIFLFVVLGVGVVLYWLICALRKWLGKKQKKNVRKR